MNLKGCIILITVILVLGIPMGIIGQNLYDECIERNIEEFNLVNEEIAKDICN